MFLLDIFVPMSRNTEPVPVDIQFDMHCQITLSLTGLCRIPELFFNESLMHPFDPERNFEIVQDKLKAATRQLRVRFINSASSHVEIKDSTSFI